MIYSLFEDDPMILRICPNCLMKGWRGTLAGEGAGMETLE